MAGIELSTWVESILAWLRVCKREDVPRRDEVALSRAVDGGLSSLVLAALLGGVSSSLMVSISPIRSLSTRLSLCESAPTHSTLASPLTNKHNHKLFYRSNLHHMTLITTTDPTYSSFPTHRFFFVLGKSSLFHCLLTRKLWRLVI